MRKYIATRPPPPDTGSHTRPHGFVRHKPVERHRSLIGRIIVILLLVAAVGVLALLAFKVWVDSQTAGLIYAYDDPGLPANHVALVFGAGLNATGGPSAILYDRIATAADLYKAGKVQKLLMTGDNSTDSYNEVEAMRRTAVQLGVPEGDIVLDYAGFSSWDSCYRAREVFSLQSATLVTQKFHLPRALFTCNQLGVKSVGVIADRQPYPTQYNELREYPALAATVWRLLTNDQPRFLGPKVDIDGGQ